MSITFIFIIFSLLSLFFSVIIYSLKANAFRKKSIYKLYAIRDEFICLVAEDKLSEHSKIFQYYYKRVNILLKMAPQVGIENTLNAILFSKKGGNIEKSLKASQASAEEMQKLAENESDEVSELISDYYLASKDMILAHSSIVRVMYILLIKFHLSKLVKLIRRSSDSINIAFKAINLADREASLFKKESLSDYIN